MSQGKTTKFRGSKVYVQKGVSQTTESITKLTATNPGVIEISSSALERGDVVIITGADEFNGAYVVKEADTTAVTVVADWSGLETNESPSGAKAAPVEFSTNFCELTGLEDSGASIDWEESTTICSEGYKDFDSGMADPGTLQLNFNAAPAQKTQELLAGYELSAEKFWVKIKLTKGQGTMLYYGGIQTGPGLSGDAGTPNFTSGVTLKLSGRKFHVKDEA